MKSPLNPSEIARDTLRQLALKRKVPTPDNYREIYHEIAGTRPEVIFPELELKTLAQALPRQTQEQVRFARAIDSAIGDKSWQSLTAALGDFAAKTAGTPPNWAGLLRGLIQQYSLRHAGLTTARKREALEHVLASSASPELLFQRLQSLIRSWEQSDSEPGDATSEGAQPAPAAAAPGGPSMAPNSGDLRELTAAAFENVVMPVVADDSELAEELRAVVAAVRSAGTPDDARRLAERVKKLGYKLEFAVEDKAEVRAALQHLVTLVIENIQELVVDDQWFAGQVGVIRDLLGGPLNLRRLDDVERRIKDVIFKQSALKQSLLAAQQRLKEMLATFVDRLASFSDTTTGYHDAIERCADRISKAKHIGELSDVLDEVMRETRQMQLDAQRSRDEMAHMRARALEAEEEIVRLQSELAHASDMVRTDALTGALNRKGMDEALAREASRAARGSGPLCLALLDIDNFKKLNDGLGHDAGDEALKHLAKVVGETIRPQDTLARYGGEEFVVLLPHTALDDAVGAMVRVQRELTRRFFLHNNEKILITFSCGVSELAGGENPAETLKRADAGMYLAKRSGKNRVVAN